MSASNDSLLLIPNGIENDYRKVDIQKKSIVISGNGEQLTVVYREAQPTKGDEGKFPILLLHGASFSSKTWDDIKTIHLLNCLGHRVVAIDIPGGPKSETPALTKMSPVDFMSTLTSNLHIEKPVIISPSMSGQFSIPYLLADPKVSEKKCTGFIPVAPVGTGQFGASVYQQCQVPTLIVFGTNDKGIGAASTRDLKHLPNSKLRPMENTGHACYINNTDEWHRLLYNFIKDL